MSRKRWRLTNAQQLEYRQLIQMLRAGGADLDPNASFLSSPAWLNLEHSPLSGRVLVGESTLFLIDVKLVVTVPKIIIEEVEASTPAWDEEVFLVDEPRRVSCSRSPRYLLADNSSLGLDEVLNHRFGGHETFRRGDVLSGLILAESVSPLPAEYREGSGVRVHLCLRNQYGACHESNVTLRVHRIERPARPAVLLHRGSGLFGGTQHVGKTLTPTEDRIEKKDDGRTIADDIMRPAL